MEGDRHDPAGAPGDPPVPACGGNEPPRSEWEDESYWTPADEGTTGGGPSMVAAYYSGPIPPPMMLRELDQIVPGLAKQIAESALGQTKHRQEMERDVIRSGLAHEKLGVVTGGIIAVTGIVASATVAIMASPAAGAIMGLGTVASMVGIFVYGTDSRRKERTEKAEIQRELSADTGKKSGQQTDE